MDNSKVFEHDLVKALLNMVYDNKLITSHERKLIEEEYWVLKKKEGRKHENNYNYRGE